MKKNKEEFLMNNRERENHKESESDEEKNKLFDQKERAFYRGNIRYGEIIDFLERNSCEDEEIENKRQRMIDLYQGMERQERVNIDNVRFMLSLVDVAKRKGKKYEELSRQEVANAYGEYEKKEDLEANEESAIQYYEKALANWEDTLFVKKQTIETLICDIKYGRAKRIKDEKERQEKMADLKKEHRTIADNIDVKGLKAEVQFVYLVNEWAERQGQEHLIETRSALPLDDHKEKIDAEIVSGGKILNVNLKTFSDSSDVAEFNQALIEKERKKIAGSNIEITVLDNDKLQELWRLIKKENQITSEKARTTKLMKEMVGNIEQGFLLNKLAPVNKVKKPKAFMRKTILERYSNIPNLIRWGYLKREEAMDISAIIKAKQELAKGIEDKDVYNKIQAEMQGSN